MVIKRLRGGDDLFDRLFEFDAIDLHIAAAARADHAAKTANAHDAKFAFAARVRLFELHEHIGSKLDNLHRQPSFCTDIFQYNIKRGKCK